MLAAGQIGCVMLIVLSIFLFTIGFPLFYGKRLLGWSNKRIRFLLKSYEYNVLPNVIISLGIAWIICMLTIVFEQKWAYLDICLSCINCI